MSTAVVTVASGGLPVVELAAGKLGLPVTEATNGRGIAVTKVVGKPGLPVVFDAAFAILDTATAAGVNLSADKLTVTNTSTAAETGTRVAVGKTSGKFYFEVTTTTIVTGGGGNTGVGVATTSSTYTGMGTNGTSGAEVFVSNGGIYASGVSSGLPGIGACTSGNVIGCAIDLDLRRAWFRKAPAGLWNGSATGNPVLNDSGAIIPAGTIAPICTFDGSGATTGNVFTYNLGASAFVGAVPAGFTAGWPA